MSRFIQLLHERLSESLLEELCHIRQATDPNVREI